MNWLEQKILGLLVKTQGKISKPLFGGIGHIFMLHRVLPDNLRNQFTYNRDLAITPEFLEECIQYFIKEGYQFVSLDELTLILNQRLGSNKKKLICFTLDDGYKDNWQYGLPVFKKYNIPITLYVTNCFPNYTANLWWYWLEEKISRNNRVVFQKIEYSCNSEKEKLELYTKFRIILKNSTIKEMRLIARDFFDKTDEIIKSEVENLSLSWSDIQEFNKEELVTIGAHTQNHVSLKHISLEEDLRNEIQTAKIELETYLGAKVKHFAYPYGGLEDAGAREYRMVKDLGFDTATLNYAGNIFNQHKSSIFALPRYPLGNSISREKLNYFLNGVYHFSTNQFEKTINY